MNKLIVLAAAFTLSTSWACADNQKISARKTTNTRVSTDTINSLQTTSVSYQPNSSADSMVIGIFVYGLTPDQKISVAKKLGVHAMREEISSTATLPSPKVDAVVNAGFDLYLTINWLPGKGEGQQGPQFPTDMNAYRSFLQSVLKVYKPKIAFIENEPQTKSFHSGSMQNYINELKVAIEVCHDNGIKVADGGLTTNILPALTYQNLLKTDKQKADWFFNNCIMPQQKQFILNNTNPDLQSRLQDARYLINEYKNLNLDYVNVHLYFPLNRDQSNNSTDGLKEIIDFVRQSTSKEVITHETGIRFNNPELVANVLKAYKSLNIPVVLFYSGKGAIAAALNNGADINEEGKRFLNEMHNSQ